MTDQSIELAPEGRLPAFVRRVSGLSAGASLGPVGLLFGLNFVDEFDRVAFGTLGPEIRDAFGLTDTGLASVSIVTGLFLLFAAVPVGVVADRVTRVRLAWLAALLWGAMSVLTGIVPSLILLAIVRFFSGLGRSMNEIVHPSLLTDLYEPEDHPSVFSIHRMANPASALSALVAGGIGATLGWRWAFLLLALPTIPLLFGISRMPEPRRRRSSLGLDEVIDDGVVTPFKEARRELFALRTLRRLWLAAFVIGVAAVPIAVYLTFFFEDEFNFGPLGRGIVQLVFGAGTAAGLVLGGRLARRIPDDDDGGMLASHTGRWLLVAAGGMLLLAASPVAVLAVASLAVLGLGIGGHQPVLLPLVGLITPGHLRSQAYGLTTLFLGLGAVCSLVIFSIGESTGYRITFAIAAVIAAGGCRVVMSAASLVGTDVATSRGSGPGSDPGSDPGSNPGSNPGPAPTDPDEPPAS